MEGLKLKIGTEKSPIVIDLKEFKGRKLIDIRKYFHDKLEEDKLIPTKKGISLNPTQFAQLVEALNVNKDEINTFYNEDNLFNDNINLDIEEEVMLGRKFNLKFENNKKTLVLDSSLSSKINEDKLEVFKKMILGFYESLYDVVENDNDIQLILDRLDGKLNRIKW